jgi:ribosomal protein L3
MRCPKIANLLGLGSSLGVMIVATSLLFASIVRATEIEQLIDKLPRAYLGEFTWEGDTTVQNVVITLEAVRALNDQNVEAVGCGSYEVNRQVTMIKIRMFVRLSDLYMEIMELSPQGSTSFETDGSHRGNLSKDLQLIDAQWTTRGSGQQGQLHLRAASSAVCAPASSL